MIHCNEGGFLAFEPLPHHRAEPVYDPAVLVAFIKTFQREVLSGRKIHCETAEHISECGTSNRKVLIYYIRKDHICLVFPILDINDIVEVRELICDLLLVLTHDPGQV